jgi:hypothetical protein
MFLYIYMRNTYIITHIYIFIYQICTSMLAAALIYQIRWVETFQNQGHFLAQVQIHTHDIS